MRVDHDDRHRRETHRENNSRQLRDDVRSIGHEQAFLFRFLSVRIKTKNKTTSQNTFGTTFGDDRHWFTRCSVGLIVSKGKATSPVRSNTIYSGTLRHRRKRVENVYPVIHIIFRIGVLCRGRNDCSTARGGDAPPLTCSWGIPAGRLFDGTRAGFKRNGK